MPVVKRAGTRSCPCTDRSALASARERSDGGSRSGAHSHAFRGVHMAAVPYGAGAASARTGASLGGVIRARVTHHGGSADIGGHAEEHSRREH